MKYAADFRQIAREALSGKWMIAPDLMARK